MRYSQLFTKTLKNAPADEVAKNAQLLIRAGFIHKEMAGVYTILPLGYKVLENIVDIVKEEMDAVGGIQMKTSALQSKDVWERTNRWSDEVVDNWFKTSLKNGTEIGLSFTNEEAYASLMRNFIRSYKDLPVYPYDFKTIFRNETRSKSGVMRGREFYWKALYSFSKDQAEHDEFYEKMKNAYTKVFSRVGIGDKTYITFASGGTFSKYSHEFQTISSAGEDTIYVDNGSRIAVNKEVFTDDVLTDIGVSKENLEEHKAIEVGNIFSLEYKFSNPFDLTYTNESGVEKPVFMGSYGIGITRLMGTIAEVLSDEKGLVWPESIAPARVHLISLGADEQADELYKTLQEKNITVLYDDRDVRAGEKFADADLIGIPHRVVVSAKTVAQGKFEYKKRTDSESKIIDLDELLELVSIH
ncbi:prolyl-tRNA synthetase [Candidatus Saccharibacteria bacterium]|nr:prolyl-tRNA synthetase [Candidatus Saccharibacteria bacterium]MDQ5913335.1 prolyl-tRNA synthetase [Patescibacteria group bacterium]